MTSAFGIFVKKPFMSEPAQRTRSSHLHGGGELMSSFHPVRRSPGCRHSQFNAKSTPRTIATRAPTVSGDRRILSLL
jgi:hypothetical protein